MWQPRLTEGARMKYLGIVEALEADIRSGRVAPGERLPAQRAIAEALNVDLTTVTRAFNEARRRGLVDAQAGRGTFIAEPDRKPARPSARPSPIDLSMNIPPQPAAVDFRRLMPQGLAAAMAGPRGLLNLHYQDSAGTEADREAGALWLSGRLAAPSAERIVMASGAQAALFALCDLLLAPGEAIAAGAVTYPGLKAVAARRNLVLRPVAMDENGLKPEAFEALCREKPPKALYVVPTMDNPTSATLPLERRRALAGIADRHGVTIIEDDPYAPLRAEPLPALSDLAASGWHIATLSKCATPALRIAYVAAPDPAAARRLGEALRASTLMAPPLMAALARAWIADGTLKLLSAAIAAENEQRQALAATLLAGRAFAADPRGPHLWLSLPAPWHPDDFTAYADRAGVSIVSSSAFATGPAPADAVRISLGIAPDKGALEDGLTLLADLMARPPMAARMVV